MSEIVCPRCHGNKKLTGIFPSYAPGRSGPPVIEMDCHICRGTGTVDSKTIQLIEAGRRCRKFRVEICGLGLRRAAEQWGMNPSELSRIEQGVSENTKWKPPGYPEEENE